MFRRLLVQNNTIVAASKNFTGLPATISPPETDSQKQKIIAQCRNYFQISQAIATEHSSRRNLFWSSLQQMHLLFHSLLQQQNELIGNSASSWIKLEQLVNLINFRPVDDEQLEALRNSSTRELYLQDGSVPIPFSKKPLRPPLLFMDPYETFIAQSLSQTVSDEDKLWTILLVYLVGRLSTLHSLGIPQATTTGVTAFTETMQKCLSQGGTFFGGDWQAYNAEALKNTMWTWYMPEKRRQLLQQLQEKSFLSAVSSILKKLLPDVCILDNL